MGFHETVKTVNSTIRTTIAAIIVAAAAFFGYQGYEIYNEPQLKLADAHRELEAVKASYETARGELAAKQEEVVALGVELEEKAKEIDRLDTALRLHKVDRRVAELKILDQETDDETGDVTTRISFVETNPEGHPIGEPQVFEVPGEKIYVDYLVAKFDDKYVEESDLLRGVAICVFQRVFGDKQQPSEGFTLDKVGTRPTAYARGGAPSEFEEQIWDDFWTLANDQERAEELGLRAAQGQAVYTRVEPGKTYRIQMRSTGDFTLGPVE
jgi:hypothetical protein